MTLFSTIIVPHDFSETAERAFRAACNLARDPEARVHLLHVQSPPAYTFAGEAHVGLAAYGVTGTSMQLEAVASSHARLERLARAAAFPATRIHLHVVEASSVARAIVSAADHLGADLIAMGTHGRTGLAHLLMGSVAEETLRNASCPVLAVPLVRARAPQAERWEASRHPPLGAL